MIITDKILVYYLLGGKKKPSDIVGKHWSYPQVWHLLKPLLFYSGDTMDMINPNKKESAENSNELC
jgi:hypothetical protein